MIVVALSKYGFKVDSLKNDWEKVDKSLLSRDVFKNLKRGDELEIVSRNSGGFITEIKVSPMAVIIPESKVSNVDPVQRNILKGQCLNIVMNQLFNDKNVECDDVRELGIRLAHRLFVELESADYYGW